MKKPTTTSVLQAITHYSKIGEEKFLQKYATGHRPRIYYFQHGKLMIPLKALWAAAHTPPITTRPFSTSHARWGLKRLGFAQNYPALDALRDIGSDAADTRISLTKSFLRDPRVRAAVMRRAKGKCEFCGITGFEAITGKPYLESHHIILLAADGQDRLTNVIALCPNHHRAAHFAKDRDELERAMTDIVSAKQAGATTRRK